MHSFCVQEQIAGPRQCTKLPSSLLPRDTKSTSQQLALLDRLICSSTVLEALQAVSRPSTRCSHPSAGVQLCASCHASLLSRSALLSAACSRLQRGRLPGCTSRRASDYREGPLAVQKIQSLFGGTAQDGYAVLTTHRLLWIDTAKAPEAGASCCLLLSTVKHVQSKSSHIFGTPKVRLEVHVSHDSKPVPGASFLPADLHDMWRMPETLRVSQWQATHKHLHGRQSCLPRNHLDRKSATLPGCSL